MAVKSLRREFCSIEFDGVGVALEGSPAAVRAALDFPDTSKHPAGFAQLTTAEGALVYVDPSLPWRVTAG